ncbi:MAG: phospho-N-acetylmuramoyl-pentapeptide-transferase [Firmicutes bacterium]|nr:phospho-N-acetylmuramoyl-pentapeptide-transferase [Bacillota bacterium]
MKAIDIISFLSGLVLCRILTPYIYVLLKENNCVSYNYQNRTIPIGIGIVYLFVQSIICFGVIFIIYNDNINIYAYIFCITIMGLVGFIDDVMGNNIIKGFKGHIKALIVGKLTTGGLKAISGLVCSIIYSIVISDNIYNLIINIIIISLFTNLINLLDLRPGRAIKAFIIIGVLLLFTSLKLEYNFLLFSAIGIILVVFPLDLKGKVMIGDIGSNSLGMTLGIYCVTTQSINYKIIILIILISLHIFSEYYSFSKVISKIKVLNFIDTLGR